MAGQNPSDAFALYRSGNFAAAERAACSGLAGGDNPQLLHLAGVLACRRGDLELGAERFDRALSLEPRNVEIRIALVRALIDLGRGPAALDFARRPAPGPAALPLWRLRAEAAAAAGTPADRLEAERSADLLDTEARLERRPDDHELLLRRARLLGTFRRDEEAEAIYRGLIERNPADVEAIAELGQILDRGNRIAELEALLAAADAAGAPAAALAYLYATAAWRRKDLAVARSLLERAGPGHDPVRHHALLAKVADAQGDWVAATAAIRAKSAAAPNRDEWLAAAARFRRAMRAFAAAIQPDWAARFASPSAADRPAPAFLLGFPRSGTTLLDTFLMGHPRVRVLEEEPLIGFVSEALGPPERIAVIDEAEVDRLRAIYTDRLATIVDPSFDGLVIDKMPINTLAAPIIYRLFPQAKIIFAQRHPCDCVLSGLMQNFNLNPGMASFLDPRAAADFYDVTLEAWSRSAALFPLDVHTVRYEVLVAEPASVMRGLAGFLGLDWHDALGDHLPAAGERGRISTASYDQVPEPVHQRSVGRWTHYRDLLGPALPKLRDWAGRLGYADD